MAAPGGPPEVANGEGGGEPDAPSTAGYVVVGVGLVAFIVISTVLIGLPPKWPQDFRGWALLVLGAGFTLFNAILVPKYRALAAVATRYLAHPGESLKRFFRDGWRVLIMIAVCALVGGLSTYVGPPAASTSLEPGNIVVLSAFSQSPDDPRRILINQWNQSHPDNQVITQDVPGGTDSQHDRYVRDAQPNGKHEADVYVLDNVWMPEFIMGNYIRAIDETLSRATDENFTRNVFATCKDPTGQRPGTWALPLNADAGLLFYRPDLLGPQSPSAWDQYAGLGASDAFNRVTGDAALARRAPTFQAGNAAQLADSDEISTVSMFEAIWGAGGQVATLDGQPVLSPDGNQLIFDPQAMIGLQNLARAYADRAATLPEADRSTSDDAITQFRTGRTAFLRNWAVTADKLRDPAQGPSVPFSVAALPGVSVLGGQNLAISSHTAKPRAAQAFIQFMTSPASELTMFEIGGVPPTRDDVYAQVSQLSRPYAEAVRISVQRARPRVSTPYYTKFSQEFRKGLLTAIRNRGQIDPELPTRLAAILHGG